MLVVKRTFAWDLAVEAQKWGRHRCFTAQKIVALGAEMKPFVSSDEDEKWAPHNPHHDSFPNVTFLFLDSIGWFIVPIPPPFLSPPPTMDDMRRNPSYSFHIPNSISFWPSFCYPRTRSKRRPVSRGMRLPGLWRGRPRAYLQYLWRRHSLTPLFHAPRGINLYRSHTQGKSWNLREQRFDNMWIFLPAREHFPPFLCNVKLGRKTRHKKMNRQTVFPMFCSQHGLIFAMNRMRPWVAFEGHIRRDRDHFVKRSAGSSGATGTH